MQNAERIFSRESSKNSSALIFAASFIALCALAAFLIGAFPLQASIWTIFLFAGVHNFMEFRYFLARMPARWGKSRIFYTVGISGVSVLTTAYLLIYFTSGWLWSAETAVVTTASWNTFFVLWLALLFYLRGRQKPKADWSFAFAVGLFAASFAWLAPHFFALALVYLHPFVALWFCERQIRRTKSKWLPAFRICLASIPIFLAALWLASFNFQNLPAEDYLSWRIAQHAGGEILLGISSHLLVATHVFLETVHYSVWILLIPLADRRAVPFEIKTIPLFSGKNGFPRLVMAILAISFLAVTALWIGFSADYATTRDVYFAFAIAHVLAEFPFLIKML
jgi:hypothetical protein